MTRASKHGAARLLGAPLPLRAVVPCLAIVSCLAVSSCIEEQRYVIAGETVLMTPDVPVAYVTEEDEEPVYRVDRPFALRITPPSAMELAQLSANAAGRMLPFPRLPWISLHDLELQVDYAVSNQSDEPLVATVTLNGINEFVYYAPGPENYHQWQRRIALAPGQRVSGTVTELELDELAVDLATVVNGAPNSNLVVDPSSQSGRDPRVAAFIPGVIPGLVGLRAGLETMRNVNITLEVFVRVQDHATRAAKRGDQNWMLPEPAAFTPIVPVDG